MRFLTLYLSVLALAFLIGCGGQVDEPDWTYSGLAGPHNWHSLSDEYARCDGMEQSPIDITGYVDASGPGITFYYHDNATGIATSAKNNGRATYYGFAEENMLLRDWKDGFKWAFILETAQLHVPSEHTVDGEQFAAELHLIHRSEHYSIVNDIVVAVLFRLGSASPMVQAMIDNAPGVGKEAKEGLRLSARNLAPSGSDYYFYNGSLTTSPCDEYVDWYVMQTPLTISQEQVDVLVEMHGRTNRPTQDLNDRTIYAVGH